MAYDFPASPTTGQKYPVAPAVGQPQYTFDGVKWTTAVLPTLADARLMRGLDPATNMRIAATVASNNLTLALTGADGNAISPVNPIYIPFRSPTIADGTLTVMTVTAPIQITAPSGAHFAINANNFPFRLWLVAFNDAGSLRLGLIQCWQGGGSIYSLCRDVASATTIGPGAISAQTFYATAVVTNKPFTVLGYLEYSAGLATGGQYNVVPTKLQLFGSGIPLPGQSTGNTVYQIQGAGGSTTSTSMVDAPNTSFTINLSATMNLVRFNYNWYCAIASGGGGNQAVYTAQVYRVAGTVILGYMSMSAVQPSTQNIGLYGPMSASGLDNPNAASANYRIRHNTNLATAASQTVNINVLLEEIMV